YRRHARSLCALGGPPRPRSTPFPYTTLFRSGRAGAAALPARRRAALGPVPADEELRVELGFGRAGRGRPVVLPLDPRRKRHEDRDRKSTRLNSSHVKISYAVFCLKNKREHD